MLSMTGTVRLSLKRNASYQSLPTKIVLLGAKREPQRWDPVKGRVRLRTVDLRQSCVRPPQQVECVGRTARCRKLGRSLPTNSDGGGQEGARTLSPIHRASTTRHCARGRISDPAALDSSCHHGSQVVQLRRQSGQEPAFDHSIWVCQQDGVDGYVAVNGVACPGGRRARKSSVAQSGGHRWSVGLQGQTGHKYLEFLYGIRVQCPARIRPPTEDFQFDDHGSGPAQLMTTDRPA